ncbi:leukocyte cell-derived chemotaxin-2-like isoform X2 [Ambystoma mexicanum]|uniref:leukocyte cell-derived chemotaxin-2-like isoform X2 n=1 Tax=Ambystoma mexicanum TaxID=8296 RepID=UPI0037E9AB5A
MDRVTLALLGGLLLCTGIPAGQATEAEPFTATTTTQYPNYPTTGRCGTEPELCCSGRKDSCRRVDCHCDHACFHTFHDCCSDYMPVCKNGYTPLPFTTGPEYAADQPFTVSREDLEPEPGRRFPLLSSGQRKNLIRRCDLYGCGCYGSPRGHSLLKGVDIVCRDGATVYAPFTGTVMSLERTYGDENDRPSGEGFMFVGSGFCLKIFNVHQDGQSGEITKGCRMGTLIPMQLKYPRITSHMHVQKCDLSDPTGLLS